MPEENSQPRTREGMESGSFFPGGRFQSPFLPHNSVVATLAGDAGFRELKIPSAIPAF